MEPRSIDTTHADAGAASSAALPRVLGPVDATCVVIGAIIGVGIFFTPSQVARSAGSAEMALLAWSVGGGIAMLGALTFASLGAVYSGAGAQYTILRDAYGPLPAFLFVFCNATAIQAGATAVIGLVCAQNIGVAVRGEAMGGAALMLSATLLIIALTAANCLGAAWGSGIQNITVFAKVAVLIAIAAVAMLAEPATTAAASPAEAAVAPASASPAGAPASAGLLTMLFAAVVPTIFSYGGWQQALWMAGEVREPRRNVPLAIIVGVAVVVGVYLVANWAYLRLLGYEGVVGAGALAADAVTQVWPTWGRRAIAAGVAVSAFGVLNAQLLAGPRLIYRLAADGRFFSVFARVAPRRRTPMAAILLLGGLALVLLYAAGGDQGIGTLTAWVVFVDCVFFALTGLAPLILRRRTGAADRDWPGFGYPVVPVLFVLGEMGVLIGALMNEATTTVALIGLAWIAAAAGLYLACFRGHGRAVGSWRE